MSYAEGKMKRTVVRRFNPLQLIGALAIIAAVLVVYRRVLPVNSTTVALTLLLAVLAISTWWGLVEAIAAALFAVLGFNFWFLPPVGTFTIADPQNWIALFAFLITAVIASQLSSRAKRRALEAERRRQEMERLYTVGQAMLLRGSPAAVAREALDHLIDGFGLDSGAFHDSTTGRTYTSGHSVADLPAPELKRVAEVGEVMLHNDLAVLPVRLGGQPVGSVALAGNLPSEETLRTLANLIAIGVERARALEQASRADAARQSEALKSALLDALAHDLKTPITAIKAAATGMLAHGHEAGEHELLTVIDEEADRLNRLVAGAIEMARIESGKLQPDLAPHRVSELARSAVSASAGVLAGHPVRITVPDELPAVEVDGDFIHEVFKQLLDNAARYSPPGSSIDISAERRDRKVLVSVIDSGCGIHEQDLPRVFDKFYRGAEQRSAVPGTGMGLAIAKGIVEAHGGKIWVTSELKRGSVFTFSLPTAKEPEG
jgi:two-component system sensor histidine kinase KdpD